MKILVISFFLIYFHITGYGLINNKSFRINNKICLPYNKSVPISNAYLADPTCAGLYIPYTSVAPIIDQNIDPCWSASPVGTFTKVPNGTMPADFAGSQWRALYDNNYLYFLVEVKDAFKYNDSGYPWDDDAIEIYIDGNNSKNVTYDGINDYQFGFLYNDSVVWTGANSLTNTAGVKFSMQDLTDGYVMEIRIPWSTIGVTPSSGNPIGIEVEVNDDDNGGTRDAQIAAFDNTAAAWYDPRAIGTMTLCNSSPGVILSKSITQADPTGLSPINFTATFTESVTGFTNSDITIGGTAGANSVIVTGSNPYNLAVNGMTADGTVTVSISAGVCTDSYGNLNTGSVNTDNSVIYNTRKPGVTITQAITQTDPTNISLINFTATFTEAVTGFTSSDIIITGTAGAATAVVSGTGPYNIAVSGMTSDGTVIVTINAGACTNVLGNLNTVSVNTDNTVAFDNTKPGVTIAQAVGQSNPTGASPINFTATFTETVTGFDFGDITVGGTAGATTVVLSGTGPVYNVAVSGMNSGGTVTISIGAGICSDLAGNTNTASVNTDNTVTFDNTKPGVTIAQAVGQSNPTGASPINFTATFTETVTGFDFGDITVGGTAGATTVVLSGTGPVYNIAVTGMNREGTVTISIGEGICSDLAGNTNTASVNTDNTVAFDNVKPDVLVTSTANSQTSLATIPIKFEFSKKITDFNETDIKISNGTISSLTESVQGIQWDGSITPISAGIITVYISANAATDGAGNNNNASNDFQIEYLTIENSVFEAVNIITPNSNRNRYWTIKNVDLYKDYQLIIRNGNGQVVYQTTNYQNDWNGTYNNKALPTGTYYYFFSNPSKNSIYKGFVNIIYE